MTFLDIIAKWPSLADLARDVGLPVKNVRRWHDIGSIPAEWFVTVEAAAARRGIGNVNVESLSKAAHDRRLAKVSAANDDALPHSEAA